MLYTFLLIKGGYIALFLRDTDLLFYLSYIYSM